MAAAFAYADSTPVVTPDSFHAIAIFSRRPAHPDLLEHFAIDNAR